MIHTVAGYTVVFVPTKVDTFYIKSSIHTGFIFETKKNTGVNHLLEHVLTDSWKTCSPDGCNGYWDKKGVEMNAETKNNALEYYVYGMPNEAINMTKYIIDITFNPHMESSSLEREKIAVKNELLSYANEPIESLDKAFNHHFFNIEGLHYADDWKQQIKNLDTLTLSSLKQTYHSYYTTANIVFVVCGNFSIPKILSIFQKELRPRPKGVINRHGECFTRKKQIIFVKNPDIHSSTIRFGFPTTLKANDPWQMYIHTILTSIGNILFDELRRKAKLIYSVNCEHNTTSCGTYTTIEIDTEPNHIEEVYHRVLSVLHHIPESFLYGAIQSHKLSYQDNQYDNVHIGDYVSDQYTAQLMLDPHYYTMKEQMDKVSKLSTTLANRILRRMFVLDEYLCVYQNTHKIYFHKT
jgi:predicted Zn-dependent peptidase